MRRFKLPFAVALAGFALLLHASALAQTTEKVEPNSYRYDFDDDYMVGDTLGTTPPLLKLRTKLPRIMLIRPRSSFVVEMVKSVESM